MIRILLTIVALVAAILAVVVDEPLLFVAAGLSLVISVILMVVRFRRRRSGYGQPAARMPEPEVEESNDLASLGILDIRPRQKGGSDVGGEQAGEERAAGGSTEESDRQSQGSFSSTSSAGSSDSGRTSTNGARERSPVQSTITIKEREQIVRASVDESAPAHFRDVLVPYLQAFRAAVGANTVCLLKQPDESSHYHIEAIVSLNAYARSSGTFSSKRQLLDRHDVRSAPEVTRASDGNLSPHELGYYRESIAVKEFATAAVPRPTSAARYILLADAMREHTLDSDRILSLISYFARLLGAVLDKGGGEDVLDDGEEYVRPRREIIGEEIRRARRDDVPLALALVYLNNAESIADLGEREIAGTERLLSDRLRDSAGKARIERFGELTFGVFFKEAGPYVEQWAVDFQKGLEDADGKLGGGVSIGIALLDERHADADSFRRDATDALREAYESGTCTIVE